MLSCIALANHILSLVSLLFRREPKFIISCQKASEKHRSNYFEHFYFVVDLRDAITIVTNRLESTGTPWSLLCHYLNWPKQFLLSLRSSNARDRRRAFSDRESSSSSSSALSQSEEKSSEDLLLRRFTTTVSTQRIVNYVKSNCPGSECDRCAFMLKLWLDKNGHLATLELLLKALQDVRSAEDELIELRQNADA